MTAINGVGAATTCPTPHTNVNDSLHSNGDRVACAVFGVALLGMTFFRGLIPPCSHGFKATDNFSKIVLTTIIGTVALASLKSLVLVYPVLAVYIHATIVVLAMAAIIKLVKDM